MCTSLAACFPAGTAKTKKAAWQDRSLDTGPDVRIRLIRKAYFSQASIQWDNADVLLTDEKGHAIPLPAGAKKGYFRIRGEQVAVAFQRTPAELKKAKRYQKVWIRTQDNSVRRFKIHIPEQQVLREYDAKGFHLSVKYGRMAVINVIPLERYLAQVIPEEMDPEHFTLEALKAQAVVARTWALKNMKRHDRYEYDFCDGPHCQVYKGRKKVSSRAERAVKMTLGEVVTYQQRLAEAFYHSTCGGNTVFVNEVWAGQRIPYLARVEDHWQEGNRPYCAQSPYAHWRVLTSLRRVERVLQHLKYLAKKERLLNVQVFFLNRSGRVKRVCLTTDKKSFTMTSVEFRNVLNQELGKRKLLSNFYDISVDGSQFLITGNGLGHGVGMCQWGARGMAQHGFSYRQILQHYFRGTELGYAYGSEAPAPFSRSTTQNSQADAK
ncbi:SpoIID/LytB domain-containing protein [candidate division FCPU426 bacterium]|nr:SpoIID/LytB domain-containing protein [candidate division FCPU426 bacterium]